jgi:hypothetical protein
VSGTSSTATVINPNTRRLQRSFAPLAKHYGVGVDPCPPRHSNRKGVVEKNIDFLTRRWWRTAPGSAHQPRRRPPSTGSASPPPMPAGAATRPSVCSPMPNPCWRCRSSAYPAEVLACTVAANPLVSLWGNRYSVLPGLVGDYVQIRWRVGADTISMHAHGQLICTHQLAPRVRSAPSGSARRPRRWRTWCSDRSVPTGPASGR